MASRSQITKLAARIEALAAATEGRPAYVWRNTDESEEQALERHYKDRPEDRKAGLMYIIQWAGRRDQAGAS